MVQFSANDDSLEASEGTRHSQSEKMTGSFGRGQFDLASATHALPLVGRIVADLVSLTRELNEQQAQIAGLDKLPKPNKQTAFADELEAIRESFRADRQRLDSCYRELESLGVKVDSVEHGVVDFPASINHQPVLLCWQLGEHAVGHWHRVDENFAQRQELGELAIDPLHPLPQRS